MPKASDQDIKAIIQAAVNVSGDCDIDDNGDCNSCHQEIDKSEDEDNTLCQNRDCRAYVMRKLFQQMAKKYGFKMPTMNV